MKSNTKVLDELVENLRLVSRLCVHVGIWSGPHPAGIDMLKLGLIHEFGTDDGMIPARPFIRNGIESVKEELVKVKSRLFTKIIANKITTRDALAELGEFCVRAIQEYLRNANDLAPLADSTVAAKGHDKPLIETGSLYDAITYKIVEK